MRYVKKEAEKHPCKRDCNRVVSVLNRSTWGLGELKQKYEGICWFCLRRSEKAEIMKAMGKHFKVSE